LSDATRMVARPWRPGRADCPLSLRGVEVAPGRLKSVRSLFSALEFSCCSGIGSYSYSYSNRTLITTLVFDHDRLGVDRLPTDEFAASFESAKSLVGHHRHARHQWRPAASSISLNIAQGNGKRSSRDRNRFPDIARGSASACAAVQDVLAATDGIHSDGHDDRKTMLKRIGSMLTRFIARPDKVSKPAAE